MLFLEKAEAKFVLKLLEEENTRKKESLTIFPGIYGRKNGKRRTEA